MYATDITSRAQRILQDNTGIRWPDKELVDYLNDAQKQIVLYRPDAYAQNEAISLDDGSKQKIPSSGIRFLRAIRNMGADGATPGKAVREAYRDALDNEVPDWHTDTQEGATIRHYLFDDVDPTRFYVYPVPDNTSTTQVHLEIVYSSNPADIDAANLGNKDSTEELDLGDHYINPVLDWVLYRAYSKDASYAANGQRANHHLQSFANELNVTMNVGWTVSGGEVSGGRGSPQQEGDR